MTYIAVAIAISLVVLLRFTVFSAAANERRTFRRAPLVPIAALRDDARVRVAGTLTALEPTVIAPASGRMSVYYELTLSTWAMNGEREELAYRSGLRCTLDDGTGTIDIDLTPSATRVRVLGADDLPYSAVDTKSPAMLALMHTLGRREAFERGDYRPLAREVALTEGTHVELCGRVRVATDGARLEPIEGRLHVAVHESAQTRAFD